MKNPPWLPLVVVAAVALTGCVEEGIDFEKHASTAESFEKEATAGFDFDPSLSQPMRLAKVQFRIPRGKIVARYPLVYFTCNLDSWLAKRTIEEYWGSDRFNSDEITYSDHFYDALKNANYNVVGDPGRLFNVSAERARAVYQVGAQVVDLSMELCVLQPGWQGKKALHTRGRAEMEVRWQVYSNFERKIVYTARTKGAAADTEGRLDGRQLLMVEAFVDAARKLVRDRKFFRVVSRDPRDRPEESASARGVPKGIFIKKLPLLKGKLRDHIDRVRSAVVTITQGGTHGSGFFIDSVGYVLTNAHVVGDARFVRVELFNERGILGEVVRIDKRRDVAFIVTEERNFPALSIRKKPVAITEDVFAIGTPLNRRLRTSVTKGTVSGFRDNRVGLKEIQADVDIQGGNSGGPLVDESGNVVGITVAGIGPPGKYSAGVNFFIPIQDALRALHIQFKERSAKTRDRTPKKTIRTTVSPAP